ncbi:MAG: NAD(P)H-hydrate dehydratase [Prolixibacteraceae bacterium]|nr:NAD(P)H-hydrate dehydratase [Prolixibacteraceae bacterium]MBN2773904.1 NAD(P)H-hydrate dehydratase [Prolixibacteraceae bacterium]
MKIFTTKQIAEIDRYTIENEPIADIDLMERASLQMVNWLIQNISNEKNLMVFAGPGNNGGDALAIARMMADYDYQVNVFLLDTDKGLKGSPAINWKRLEDQNKVQLNKIKDENDIPEIKDEIIIDGLFGSGLSRPLEGLPAAIVRKINGNNTTVVAVDIPSGLMGEDNSTNISEHIICADYTLTLQFPKISFFFAENEKYLGKWEVLPIGLHPDAIRNTPSEFSCISEKEIADLIPVRSKFTHKGTVGHALLISGSYGKMGAAVLASKGCLRAGVGLLTTHVPRLGYGIIQATVPEAMCSIDRSDLIFTEFPDPSKFTAIGVGPGLDTKHNTQRALYELVECATKPMVIDADALNILSMHQEWLEELPENSILTPHPGEFKRLVGGSENSYKRLMLQKEFAEKYKVIVVLKGAYTTIVLPNRKVFFNSTGNPGMATAGCGDTLTGILTGLLAQGIKAESAAVIGVYIHGLAADIALQNSSEESLIAGDIIDNLGKAFLKIKSSKKG